MTEILIPEATQCPECGEKDYIAVILVGQLFVTILCLSCGYDNSMLPEFKKDD